MKYSSILTHLAAMAVITIIIGLIYAAVQQTYRTNANDPQIQLAGDIAALLENNQSPDRIIPDDTIDIATSLRCFVALYNANGQPVHSTGFYNNKFPQPPAGVFEFARVHRGYDVTWQPSAGVRMALVILPVHTPNGGFVVAGRSLREVELRVSRLNNMVVLAWLFCAGIVMAHFIITVYMSRIKNRKQ